MQVHFPEGSNAPLPDLAGAEVAVFHAHPDDEVFATTAATLSLAAAGARVRLFVATGGELGEQSADPALGEAAARAIREQRLDRSCRILGIHEWRYLTRPGQWVDAPAAASNALANAPVATIAAAVRAAVDQCRPEIVLSVGPDGLTGHPDHIAMHDAVAAALSGPGWQPRHAWGAVTVDAHVRAADAVMGRLSPGPPPGGPDKITGVAPARIARTLSSADARQIRPQAMDLYLEGLGSYPVERLISEYGLRGAALTLRVVFEVAGWETDHFVQITGA